jgi:hypothetical protein
MAQTATAELNTAMETSSAAVLMTLRSMSRSPCSWCAHLRSVDVPCKPTPNPGLESESTNP